MREVEPPSLDAIIDAARVGDHPTPEDRERNKRAVLAKIVGAATAGGSIVASASPTAAAPVITAATATASALGAKLAGGAVVLALVSAGAVVTRSQRAATPRSTAVSSRPTQSSGLAIHQQSARVSTPVTVTPSASPTTPTTALSVTPTTAPAVAPAVVAIAAPSVGTLAAEPARPLAPSVATRPSRAARVAPSSLADELTLLRAARGALSRSDATLALATLDRYAQRFSRGMLRPESLALRVDALCSAGQRDRARAVAAELAREAPGSPLVARTQSACR